MAGLSQGQHAFRLKGRQKCIHHQEILKLICLDCQELARTECVTSLHRRHDFCNLKDKVPEAKEEIRKFMNDTEKRKFSDIDQAIISARDILKKDSNHFDFLENEVKQQHEKLKHELELLSAKILSSYQQLRKENTDIVTGYIKGLEIRRDEFDKFLNERGTVLQSGSLVHIYDLRNEIHDIKPLPEKPTLGSASFTPSKQPFNHIKKSFGAVIKHDGQVHEGQPADLQWPSSENWSLGNRQPSSTQQQPVHHQTLSTLKKPKYKLLPRSKVIKEFRDKYGVKSISTTNNKGAYVCTWLDNKVRLLNIKGEVQQEIEYNVNISDVRISPTTQYIWTCCDEDNSVMECVPSDKPYKPVVRFNTDNKPRCLCVTLDNCILIGMSEQIRKYTTQGKILLTTKPSKSGQPVIMTPYSITECSVTHNVAVVVKDNKDDKGDEKRHVLVMDRNLQEIFRYRGDIPTKYHLTVMKRLKTFYPVDVRYDSVGNLVIGDCDRGCVHLISGEGDYLTLIYSEDTVVCNVAIDENNILWVVTDYGGKVKLLQYCNIDV